MPLLLALASLALAGPLDPADYSSLGALAPTGDVTIDTTALSMSGGASFTGVDAGGIAVFTFDSVLLNGLTVTVVGDKPVAILSQGDATLLSATIDASASGTVAGPGGYDEGSGPGVGASGLAGMGSGGGGFGGAGGAGDGTSGGAAYGDLAVALEGGSGGGTHASGDSGGAGGGAIELGATGTLTIDALSALRANGSSGTATSGQGAGGGGAGGGILIHSTAATVFGTLEAGGGDGAVDTLGGGGGGGGRICAAIPASSPAIDVSGGSATGVTAGGGAPGTICIGDADGDGSPFHLDCNENNATIYPGAPEIPGDGIDQNCNGYDADLGPEALVPGDLVINEIMANPSYVADTDGEWFEIYNTLPLSVELQGLDVYDLGSDSTTVATSLVIPANGYVTLGINDNTGTNGNAPVDYQYDGFLIANSGDEIVIAYNGTVIDEVVYDSGNGWTVWIGTSMTLDPRSADATSNDNPLNWCTSNAPWTGSNDLGTPLLENILCNRDLDMDGTPESLDCDDNDPTLNFNDADLDGWASCEGDCDDFDGSLNPTDTDGDGFTSCTDPQDCDNYSAVAQPADVDGDGFTGCDGDCDDTDPDVNPDGVEVPDNGKDDDCLDGDEITPATTDTGTGTGATGTATGGTGTGTTPTVPDDGKGCGCATTSQAPASPVLLLLGALALRRRQNG